MSELRLQVGPDFVLMAAALYFFGGTEALCAVLAASAVHELGHLTAMELCGAKTVKLRLGAGGAVLDYAMAGSPWREGILLAAGPLAGALFGGLCLLTGEEFFRFAGAAALLSTGFNLLPALPLDGGRLWRLVLCSAVGQRRGERVLMLLGCLSALLLFGLGLRWRTIVLCAAGIWLGLLVIFPSMR